MREASENQLDAMSHLQDAHLLVFVYTPLCGTCKVAATMLSVLCATYTVTDLVQANISSIPLLRERWEIQSVPCLIRFAHGQRQANIYAFHSVPFLAQQIRPWIC